MLVSIALLFTGLRKLAISRQMQFFSGNVVQCNWRVVCHNSDTFGNSYFL